MNTTSQNTITKLRVISVALLKAQTRQKSASYASAECKAETTQAVYDLLTALDAPLTAALHAINGAASKFTTTTGSEVRHVAHAAEALLDRAGVPQSERVRTTVTHVGAGPSAKAYKYAARATLVTLLRGRQGEWRMTECGATNVYPTQRETLVVTISPAAAESVTRHALAPFAVRVTSLPH
jgi:hypothetical protein